MRYKFRLLRQMSIDGQLRSPGDFVPEAASWPNLRNYLSLEWIEKLPAADDDADAVEWPPAPQNRLNEILNAEGEAHEVVVAWNRRKPRTQAIRCLNCRTRNFLPNDFEQDRTWMCHSCAQPQSITVAREHPAPTSLAEYVETISEDYVTEQGELSGDLTEAWKQRVSQ